MGGDEKKKKNMGGGRGCLVAGRIFFFLFLFSFDTL